MQFGLHAVYQPDVVSAINAARKLSFDYVQLDMNVPQFQLHVLDADRLSADLSGFGLGLHAPGDTVSLYTDLPGIRAAIIEHFVRILEFAGRAGARHVVFHAGAHPSFRAADGEPRYSQKHAEYYDGVLRENLEHLLARAAGVLVCLENYRFTDGVRRVAGHLLENGRPLRLTWDIPKSYGKPGEERFLRRHVSVVAETHLHDLLPDGRSHARVGDGTIDFLPYRPLFERVDVWHTVEVRPASEAAVSRDRVLAMLGERG